jgi:hypothetical protein
VRRTPNYHYLAVYQLMEADIVGNFGEGEYDVDQILHIYVQEQGWMRCLGSLTDSVSFSIIGSEKQKTGTLVRLATYFFAKSFPDCVRRCMQP